MAQVWSLPPNDKGRHFGSQMPSSPYNAIFKKVTSSKYLKEHFNSKIKLRRQKVAPDVPCSSADIGCFTLSSQHLSSDIDWLHSASLSETHFPVPVRYALYFCLSMCLYTWQLLKWRYEHIYYLSTKSYLIVMPTQYYFSISAPVIKLSTGPLPDNFLLYQWRKFNIIT